MATVRREINSLRLQLRLALSLVRERFDDSIEKSKDIIGKSVQKLQIEQETHNKLDAPRFKIPADLGFWEKVQIIATNTLLCKTTPEQFDEYPLEDIEIDRFLVTQSMPFSLDLFSPHIQQQIKEGGPSVVIRENASLFGGFSCFDYALLRSGEERSLYTSHDNEMLSGQLRDWRYKETDDPQVGDLVLFKRGDLATHLGVFRGNGLVESKWGNHCPFVYIHSIEAAPREYGKTVIYFHKKA